MTIAIDRDVTPQSKQTKKDYMTEFYLWATSIPPGQPLLFFSHSKDNFAGQSVLSVNTTGLVKAENEV